MNSLRTRLVVSASLVGLLAAACSSPISDSVTSDADLVAVTTVSPITNLVANIACDRALVLGLVPEGVNSHTFEPSPTHAATLADASVVFVNGLNLELPTMQLAESNVADGVEIVSLGDAAITPDEYIYDFSFPEDGGDPNPHLWTNPLHALDYAETIASTLTELDPEGADLYAQQLALVTERLEAMDVAVREATETVPEQSRRLLTYHDSFPYFAREYGWKVVGAIQPSDFAEPSPREVADLIDQIRAEQVPAIFGSEVFESPVLERIAEETGAQYVAELRDDDLPGDPGDANHSYFGLMVFDFTTMVDALGGDSSALADLPTDNLCGEAVYDS
ncbi:MAG: zinc ABC transporter substrate-binding protein [Acidimicrobiia bacterium]|nr:zinc ABC transporter substrate-binding protein [Acidimicrobiia bacterium]